MDTSLSGGEVVLESLPAYSILYGRASVFISHRLPEDEGCISTADTLPPESQGIPLAVSDINH